MRAFQPLRLARYALYGWLPFGRCYCAACERRVQGFMPYRRGASDLPALTRALEVVGSDVDRFECPRCGAHDRERHLILYLEALGMFDRLAGRRVLHFAPERRLTDRLRRAGPAEYVACDLFPASVDVRKVDMTRMPFADGSFDLLLANHVLEHVAAVPAAIAEISRVLAPGGEAVLQTPYSPVLQSTWEDPGITSPQARLQAYGQEDHVRLFGGDFAQRFSESGLQADLKGHAELLPDIDPIRYGVNPREPLMLFRKPAGAATLPE